MTLLGDDEERGGLPAAPIHAQRWLRAWSAIGGGVTVDVQSRVCAWRLHQGHDPFAEDQTRLLDELDNTPGLEAAVRVVLSTSARKMAGRALRDMGKEGLSDGD